ncbi:NAD(+) diphosphatase [Kocuria massiliensis]|uniref:NAD(+) diphosphatase n=1 Tax=Kocuria massiliensis TaxID=1926282 RepID=UPI00117A631D|nr:NAD(+) diphosphatase [Kocuria massiliensis]
MGDEAPRRVTMDSALSDQATRVLLIDGGRARVRWDSTDHAELVWGTINENHDVVAYLGLDDDACHLLLARPARHATEDLQAGDPWPEASDAGDAEKDSESSWLGLREAAPVLSRHDSTWLSVGLALMNWHDANAFCPACGSTTTPDPGGWSQTCDAEGREIFPRTDPAVICAVVHTDEESVDRLLLGNSAAWPEDRYSTFAGFVEAGESLEAAIGREVYEESSVDIDHAEYLGSQPWPFPRSLMVGFMAHAASLNTAAADGTEIRRVRWFTRDELTEALHRGEVTLPDETSIAHHLIAAWFGESLPTKKTVLGRAGTEKGSEN